ncbi:MAG: hypothetical protein ACHQ1D_07115 [Nitrososphaerales archaeon]
MEVGRQEEQTRERQRREGRGAVEKTKAVGGVVDATASDREIKAKEERKGV